MGPSIWHSLAIGAEWLCWGMFGIVWAVGALYNWRHSPQVRKRTTNPSVLAGIGIWLIVSQVPAHVWQPLKVHGHWVELLGVTILLGATVFTIWSRAALGTMWSSTPLAREEHRLRTEGPYHVTRHPIYSGILSMLLGTALIAGLGPWVAALPVALVALEIKIHQEERLMGATFPHDYPAYRRQVPQLVPLLGRLRRRPA